MFTQIQNRAFKAAATKLIMEKRAIEAFQIQRESQALKNEKKAINVLGIVFVIFLIAWVPFGILNVISASCLSCKIHPRYLNVLVWLGYISSVINPMIYNAFNKKFREAFKNILRCKCKSVRNEKITAFNNYTKTRLS